MAQPTKKRPRRNRFVKFVIASLAVMTVSHMLGWISIQRQNQPEGMELAGGLTYREETWRGTRYHILAVDLTQVEPVLLTSPTLGPGKRSLPELVKSSGEEVVAAINGDYFDEGGPQGALITALAGLQRAPNQSRVSLSFKAGAATIFPYRFSTESRVVADGNAFPLVDCFNSPYEPGRVGVYTHERGVTFGPQPVRVAQALVDITDEWVGERSAQHIRGVITQCREGKKATLFAAKPGTMVIVASNQPSVPADFPGSAASWANQYLKPGASAEVVLDTMPKLEPIAISGGPQVLRQGGYIVDEVGNRNSAFKHTSRTAVGITDDQQHLLVVVADGPYKAGIVSPMEMLKMLVRLRPRIRSFLVAGVKNIVYLCRWLVFRCGTHVLGIIPNSRGANMRDLAAFFQDHLIDGLPIRDVINLDGGSSSTMVVKKGNKAEVVNRLIEWQAVDMPTGLGFAPRR